MKEIDVLFASERASDYCLIVPVLNESRRIHDFLITCNALKNIDLILVDGGSTDNSIFPERFRELGVSSLLLVKSGNKGLSRQLQFGYKFGIEQGYAGFVTIDGNGKDNPVFLPRFTEKLDQGYDFVQGSRFIEGGRGINTPLYRLLAIRLIHVPFVGLISGERWTDTTQGFRAYSRRLLTSRSLNIQNHELARYELLFYISCLAPRLGFSCVEVPVTRSYPNAKKYSSKICGPLGNLRLFCDLLRAGFRSLNTLFMLKLRRTIK